MVMVDPAVFSFRLHHLREERGMSQSALASGISSASAVSRWESGQCVPSDEIIVQLANRLEIPVEILTHRDFDSRLLTSSDGFGDILDATFDDNQGANEGSPIASWISRVKLVFRQADPWLDTPDPRPILDDLAVDPFTISVPSSLETIELLDGMIRVKNSRDHATVNALMETLSWTVEAPNMIRRAAVEISVATLVNAGMPIAARGAVIRVDPPEVTATTEALLKLGGSSTDGLPPVTTDRSARDVAFGILSRLREIPSYDRQQVTTAVAASCPHDELVYLWASSRRISNPN